MFRHVEIESMLFWQQSELGTLKWGTYGSVYRISNWILEQVSILTGKVLLFLKGCIIFAFWGLWIMVIVDSWFHLWMRRIHRRNKALLKYFYCLFFFSPLYEGVDKWCSVRAYRALLVWFIKLTCSFLLYEQCDQTKPMLRKFLYHAT